MLKYWICLLLMTESLSVFSQKDSVSRFISIAIDVGCDFGSLDSIEEASFIVRIHLDLSRNFVDSISVLGELPKTCRLSNPTLIARENKFATEFLNSKQIEWRRWVKQFSSTQCDKMELLYPYIVIVPESNAVPGHTFFKNAFVPLFPNENRTLAPCSLLFRPLLIEWRKLRPEF